MWSFSCVYKKVHATILSLTCFNLISVLFFLQRFPCSTQVSRVGRRPSLRHGQDATTMQQAGYSSMPGDNPCSDSQIHPFKSGITAVLGLFLGKILQRFPSLTPEIRNHCSRREWRSAGGTILLCSNENLSRSRNIAVANNRSRRNHPPLQQRKLESVAEHRCCYGRNRRNYSPLHRFASLGLKSRINARKRA